MVVYVSLTSSSSHIECEQFCTFLCLNRDAESKGDNIEEVGRREGEREGGREGQIEALKFHLFCDGLCQKF